MSVWQLLVADRSKFKSVRYSKAVSEARRAALCAIRAEQIRDLERAQANGRDLQRLVQSLEKLDQVDDWFQDRLVKLQAEAEARRDRHRAVAGRAVVSMKDRGQRFARIAAMSATAEKAIRDLARFAARSPFVRHLCHRRTPRFSEPTVVGGTCDNDERQIKTVGSDS